MEHLLCEERRMEEDHRRQTCVDGLSAGCRRSRDGVVQVDWTDRGLDSGVRHVGGGGKVGEITERS